MSVSIQVGCDGERCTDRVNESLRRQRQARADKRPLPAMAQPAHYGTIETVEAWVFGDQFTVESGMIDLPEDWTVEKVEPSKRFPDGLLFRCGDCSTPEQIAARAAHGS